MSWHKKQINNICDLINIMEKKTLKLREIKTIFYKWPLKYNRKYDILLNIVGYTKLTHDFMMAKGESLTCSTCGNTYNAQYYYQQHNICYVNRRLIYLWLKVINISSKERKLHILHQLYRVSLDYLPICFFY